MLSSLRKSSEIFDPEATKEAIRTMFSPSSEYATALALRAKPYESSQRTQKREPIPGPWQQAAVTSFLKGGEGEVNSETDGFCMSIPLVAGLSCDDANRCSDEYFDSSVATAVRILSPSDGSVSRSLARARLLRQIIQNGVIDERSVETSRLLAGRISAQNVISGCNDEIKSELAAVLSILPKECFELSQIASGTSVWGEGSLSATYLDATQTFSKACPDPGNFQNCLFNILSTDTFSEAVRRNIFTGGCNCSRANFIGAYFGALFGIGTSRGIPLEWIARTDAGAHVLEKAVDLFRSRGT